MCRVGFFVNAKVQTKYWLSKKNYVFLLGEACGLVCNLPTVVTTFLPLSVEAHIFSVNGASQLLGCYQVHVFCRIFSKFGDFCEVVKFACLQLICKNFYLSLLPR